MLFSWFSSAVQWSPTLADPLGLFPRPQDFNRCSFLAWWVNQRPAHLRPVTSCHISQWPEPNSSGPGSNLSVKSSWKALASILPTAIFPAVGPEGYFNKFWLPSINTLPTERGAMCEFGPHPHCASLRAQLSFLPLAAGSDTRLGQSRCLYLRTLNLKGSDIKKRTAEKSFTGKIWGMVPGRLWIQQIFLDYKLDGLNRTEISLR